MKIKTLLLYSACLMINPAINAATGAFYAGINASRFAWNFKQEFKNFNNTALNNSWDVNENRFSGEVIGGYKVSNGRLFAALEGWYNPIKITDSTTNTDISFTTTVNAGYGGRLLFGFQEREVTLYGILGIGVASVDSTTSAVAGGTYNNAPTVNIQTNTFSANPSSRTLGIGLSYLFSNGVNVSVEYQNFRLNQTSSLTDATGSNTSPQQNTIIFSDTINIGIKYQFLAKKF